MEGAVFVQTNAAHNEVIAFSRAADGSLTRAGEFATGGAGDENAHLPSQGSVTLSFPYTPTRPTSARAPRVDLSYTFTRARDDAGGEHVQAVPVLFMEP